jgi:hypothetical protein
MARPTKYTEPLGLEICKRIASGESLRSICKDPKMPVRQTIVNWLFDENKKAFLDHYETSRGLGYDEMFDELYEIADTGEDVQRDRLRVDTRKWYLSKVMPNKYGDKLDMTSAGEKLEGNAIVIRDFKDESSADSK